MDKKSGYRFLVLKLGAIVMLLSVFTYANPENKDDYCMFVKWYEIYNEARDLFHLGKWQDAIDDYHLVIVKQPKDRSNVKTYGMNFIREFTPNRCLGIAYYKIGDYWSAKKYLERSYNQFPNDSTKEYLEKVEFELEKDVLVDKYFKNGISYFEKKDYENSINEMQKILVIRPNHESAKKYIERASSLLNINK